MIRGFENFKKWFEGYEDQYVLIGGTACSILLEEDERVFRATKDIDIILVAELLTPEFGRRFWDYIRAGDYQSRNKSNGKPQYFRFANPGNIDFPIMIELFSRSLESLNIPDGVVLTPMPFDDDISSLSAIIVNDDYYSFMQAGKIIIDNAPVLDVAHIIPFKMKAWLDLSARKAAGESIDSKTISKHKNDVFRLSVLLTPNLTVPVSQVIRLDIEEFISMIQDENVDLKALGVEGDQEGILQKIKRVYEN